MGNTTENKFHKYLMPMLLASLIVFFINCYDTIGDQFEDLESEIKYPENGLYGKNLIRESDIEITTGTNYSLAVDITGDAIVKVVFPGLSSWYWVITGVLGWANIEPDSFNGRIFFTDKEGISDMKIYFENSGSMTLEIYENDSDTPVRTKVLSW